MTAPVGNRSVEYIMFVPYDLPGEANANLMGCILFLQLPRLENDTGGEEENLPMAGFYLSHALRRTGEDRFWETRFLSPEEERLDDAHILDAVVSRAPDIICATLYLWNIERSLHLLKKAKRRLPEVKILCGGPEAAPGHPFLFKSRVPDVVTEGEGEAVFPLILKALRKGRRTDFIPVAWKAERGYVWGRKPAPVISLGTSLPPFDHPAWRPDDGGMAYLETGRGCPMRCSYCRYSQMRQRVSFLDAGEVVRRVRVLKRRGATQIRFVDPTFNANPSFDQILVGLKHLNRDKQIRFFAEIQADALREDQIGFLAETGFSELEAGVQSRDPMVLRQIHRPVRLERLETNLRRMTRTGIRMTLDLMYGLPLQSKEDVLDSLTWAWKFRQTHVQCFQTLSLPGTELRANRRRWKIRADHLPPYGVVETSSMTPEDILEIESFINEKSPTDGMTRRFVGHALPDLFREGIGLDPDQFGTPSGIPGEKSRRTLFFQGPDLFYRRKELIAMIRRAIRSEPHMLWQFALKPEIEEPLDLLEAMIREIRSHPSHWIDRFANVAGWERIASRRVFVVLKNRHRFERDWQEAAEGLLEDAFY